MNFEWLWITYKQLNIQEEFEKRIIEYNTVQRQLEEWK